MILVRQVFQIKYGYMDKVLAGMKEFAARYPESMGKGRGRILTDLSGKNFTLVLETEAASMDAYWQELEKMFQNQDQAAGMNTFFQYIESGQREYYTIELETGG